MQRNDFASMWPLSALSSALATATDRKNTMPHASPIRAGSRVFHQLGTTLRTSRPYNRDLGLARSAERDAVFVRRHPLVERLQLGISERETSTLRLPE